MVEEPTGYRLHDHVVWTHDGAAQWRKAVTLFLEEGIADNQRLLYIGGQQVEQLHADLEALPHLDELLASRRLEVWATETEPGHLEDSVGVATVARLDQLVDRAVADGFSGLRLASEVTGALADPGDATAHLRFELLVDQVAATRELVVMCGMDRLHVDAGALRDELALHPLRGLASDVPLLHAVDVDTWAVRGKVDMLSQCGFERALASLPGVLRGDVLHLQLHELEFIDVAGLRALVRLAEAVMPRGRVLLHEPPGWVARMLRLAFGPVPGLELPERETRRARSLR